MIFSQFKQKPEIADQGQIDNKTWKHKILTIHALSYAIIFNI